MHICLDHAPHHHLFLTFELTVNLVPNNANGLGPFAVWLKCRSQLLVAIYSMATIISNIHWTNRLRRPKNTADIAAVIVACPPADTAPAIQASVTVPLSGCAASYTNDDLGEPDGACRVTDCVRAAKDGRYYCCDNCPASLGRSHDDRCNRRAKRGGPRSKG